MLCHGRDTGYLFNLSNSTCNILIVVETKAVFADHNVACQARQFILKRFLKTSRQRNTPQERNYAQSDTTKG